MAEMMSPGDFAERLRNALDNLDPLDDGSYTITISPSVGELLVSALKDMDRLDWIQATAGDGWRWFVDRGRMSAVVKGRRDEYGEDTVREAIDEARALAAQEVK